MIAKIAAYVLPPPFGHPLINAGGEDFTQKKKRKKPMGFLHSEILRNDLPSYSGPFGIWRINYFEKGK